MTVKIDIDKYTANSPFISRMLHLADEAKLGESENGNGMVDTEKEVNMFLRLAEKNKDKLKKLGYSVQGGDGIFTITKTNSEYDSDTYKGVLKYDLNHDFIEERVSVGGFISARTTFNSNDDIKVTINNGNTNDVLSTVDEKGVVNSLALAFVNVFTFGGITRSLNAITKLTNVWNY